MTQRLVRSAAMLLAGGLLSGLVQAQGQVQPVFGIGLTGGGETLVTVPFSDGTTQNVSSGGLIHLYGGLRFALAPQLGVQTTIGYHVDNVSARNGSVTFRRFPVELLGQFGVSDRVWLNAGLRFATGARVSSSGVASGLDTSFSAGTGLVLEGEYLVSNGIGLTLRYVSESYKAANGVKVDGNHVGGYVKFLF